MKINITKKQYKTIMRALEVAQYPYGILKDCIDEKKEPNLYEDITMQYADFSKVNRQLREYSKDFHTDDWYDIVDGEKFLVFEKMDDFCSIFEIYNDVMQE